MADDETFGNDETFGSEGEGQINETLEAGQIRKGGYIMIKGNPCKVMDVSRSESGKGGHNVCHFVALDIFSGEKMEVRLLTSSLGCRRPRSAPRAPCRRDCVSRLPRRPSPPPCCALTAPPPAAHVAG